MLNKAEGNQMTLTPEFLMDAVKEDRQNDVEVASHKIDPRTCGLNSTQLFEVAQYIERHAAGRVEELAYAENWYLAARDSGYEIRSTYRAALTRERRKDWAGASELYRTVLADSTLKQSQRVDVNGRLGWSLHFAKDYPSSRSAYEQMLELETNPYPEYVWTILSRSTNKFLQKLQVARFLEIYNAEISSEFNTITNVEQSGSNRFVFMYWAQGLQEAPPVVKASVAAWHREVGERLVVLDQESLAYWISTDHDLSEKLPRNTAGFSDLLRAELLARYGGMWVDATTFPSSRFADFEATLADVPIFAPKYQGASISSWWITASTDSRLLRRLVAALRVYWRSHKKAVGYFMFHYMFECIALNFAEAEEEWEKSPELSSRLCHSVQSIMKQTITHAQFIDALNQAPVQKMTHKLRGFSVTPECGLGHIVRWASSPE